MEVIKQAEEIREKKITKKLKEDFGLYLYMLEEQIEKTNEMMEEAGQVMAEYGQMMTEMAKNGGPEVAKIPKQYGIKDV